METKFTEQQSLALIAEMITQARNNFQKGSGNGMIFSGLLVSFAAIMNVILAFILDNPNQSFWIWCLMIPGSFISSRIDRRNKQEAMVLTHIDTIIRSIWVAYGITIWVLLIIIFGFGFGRKFYEVFWLINPVILTMTGLAEFITAKVCRFKPYIYGAIIMWVGAICCLAVFGISQEPVIIQFFILAICMILGFVVPGHKLNKLANKNV